MTPRALISSSPASPRPFSESSRQRRRRRHHRSGRCRSSCRANHRAPGRPRFHLPRPSRLHPGQRATTEWFRDDIALASLPGVAGSVLPKAERAEDIAQIGGTVLAIIETARGFANASAIAQSRNVARLMFGSIDFQLDLGIHGEGEELLYFRSQLVLISRLAGLPAPVDGSPPHSTPRISCNPTPCAPGVSDSAASSAFIPNRSPQ